MLVLPSPEKSNSLQMKNLFLLLFFLSFQSLSGQNHLFFLHNRWVEDHPLTAAHPEYGQCEFEAIVQYFKSANFQVRAEVRPSGTAAKAYARRLAKEIDSLIQTGISPEKNYRCRNFQRWVYCHVYSLLLTKCNG